MVTSLPSFSLCISLSLSLSLSPNVPHAQYRKRFRVSYNTPFTYEWINTKQLLSVMNRTQIFSKNTGATSNIPTSMTSEDNGLFRMFKQPVWIVTAVTWSILSDEYFSAKGKRKPEFLWIGQLARIPGELMCSEKIRRRNRAIIFFFVLFLFFIQMEITSATLVMNRSVLLVRSFRWGFKNHTFSVSNIPEYYHMEGVFKNRCSFFFKGEVRRKMNFTYVLGFVVLRNVVKVFPVSSSSFARKTTGRNRTRSHSGAWRGQKTKWDLKLSLPSPTYLMQYLFILVGTTTPKLKLDAFQLWQLRSLNFQSFSDPSGIRWRVRGAREAPAPRDSPNFRRTSLLSRNEFESGTFTIVLHATSSFTYVSVIYGANFPFKTITRKLFRLFGFDSFGKSLCGCLFVANNDKLTAE